MEDFLNIYLIQCSVYGTVLYCNSENSSGKTRSVLNIVNPAHKKGTHQTTRLVK